jgi:preprotein translocase subunit SecF
MRLRRWSFAVVIALLGGTAALASTDAADVGIDFRKSITLTPQETLTQSKDYYKKMQETQRRVLSLQTKAMKDKDMVKLNCVNDKLTQLQGHMKVTDQSMSSLTLDIAKSDDTARQHEFTRITILYQKVVTLGTEAEQCIGEDVSYVGATRVDVEIDPSIPPEDPTDPPLPVPVVERPPEASPFV